MSCFSSNSFAFTVTTFMQKQDLQDDKERYLTLREVCDRNVT